MINVSSTARRRMAPRCRHTPRCPDASQPDALAAAVIAAHPGQGWWLLCNGAITFDDTGAVVGGAVIQPRRARAGAAAQSGGRAA
jgi:hypothetical protein